jgi:hypothetical protein
VACGKLGFSLAVCDELRDISDVVEGLTKLSIHDSARDKS